MPKKTQSKSSPMRVLSTCLWLVDQLQSHKRMTYKQINDLWLEHNSYLNKAGNYDLEKRTLYDYWKNIDNMFNIVVQCDRRTNEYYIEEHYDTKITDWLLSTFSISNILGESREIHDRILLEDIPSGQKFLTPIIAAMKENHPIEMTYQKFFEDNLYSVKGAPLCLKLVHQRWYVLVRVPGKAYYALYGLDRIQTLSVVEEEMFELPRGFNAGSNFEYSYGAFTTNEKSSTIIRISVNEMQRKYWRTLPIHHSQEEVEVYPTFSVFTLHLQITPDFENLLLSMGDQVRVLYPKSLAESIRKKHLLAAQIYDNQQ